MPELPDVENARICLHAKLVGARIDDVLSSNSKRISPEIRQFRAVAIGKQVSDLVRRGKELRLILSDSHAVAIHLMLAGSLKFNTRTLPVVNARFAINFDNGTQLQVVDPRNLAKLSLLEPQSNQLPSNPPDALDLDRASLSSILRTAGRRPVKLTLQDQEKILGIGNAYADEILWVAKISPLSSSSSIPAKQVGALHQAIRTVLHDAIAHVNRVDPSGTAIEIRDHLQIHAPKLPRSPTGHQILTAKVGGRGTYFTDEQVRYG